MLILGGALLGMQPQFQDLSSSLPREREEKTLETRLLQMTNQQHASFGCASTAQLTYKVEIKTLICRGLRSRWAQEYCRTLIQSHYSAQHVSVKINESEVIPSICVNTFVLLQEGLRRHERGFSGGCSSFYLRTHLVFPLHVVICLLHQ